ncbi:hypothetical protein MB02_07260 [Croceicoccus estronivorus]|uniref:TetR/AcrR family transcriptional regulator n=1 Tax=Croceicoccus estronivorus TaxID=1172626 RepID=UPI00082A31A3|nr:TetR/AcrR family transcriptional regulator [Croceicoccus estronivorus]OCC24375.1 hypothetical protein MB02_07260 [Croceicoccus estronivorus]
MARPSAALAQSDDSAVRTRLLKAAQDQILATGFFEASLDQIARRCGISKQTIYTCFDSKEHLFQEVLRMTMAEASESSELDAGALDLKDALRAYAIWVEQAASKPKNLELYRANIAAASAFPELAADLHLLRLASSKADFFLKQHRERDKLPPVPPERLVNWLGVLAMGGAAQLLGFIPSEEERQARLAGIVQAFSGGWRMPVGSIALPDRDTPFTTPRATIKTVPNGRLSPERWQDLLRIAARSFCQSGLRHTSVEEISATAGISKMTIYKRFGNKQGLFAAAIEQAVADLLDDRQPLRSRGDIPATLETIALEQDRRAARPEQTQLLRLLITEAPAQPDTARHAYERLQGEDRAELTALLEEWQAAGLIHLTNPRIAATQFLLLATRGNRRLTDTIVWNEQDALEHARDVRLLFYR